MTDQRIEPEIKLVCAECASPNIGQIVVIDPNDSDETGIELLALHEEFICFDCEAEVDIEPTFIN